jgi:hypothetical protein
MPCPPRFNVTILWTTTSTARHSPLFPIMYRHLSSSRWRLPVLAVAGAAIGISQHSQYRQARPLALAAQPEGGRHAIPAAQHLSAPNADLIKDISQGSMYGKSFIENHVTTELTKARFRQRTVCRILLPGTNTGGRSHHVHLACRSPVNPSTTHVAQTANACEGASTMGAGYTGAAGCQGEIEQGCFRQAAQPSRLQTDVRRHIHPGGIRAILNTAKHCKYTAAGLTKAVSPERARKARLDRCGPCLSSSAECLRGGC